MSEGQEVSKWVDKAMFEAAPVSNTPRVHLLYANQDPLGSIAAASMMYAGEPVTDLHAITDEQRRYYWAEVQKTHLKTPLEFVNLHFMIEGVTRGFTHQLVRQRTASYAQESLRFAVKTHLADEVQTPPSYEGDDPDGPLRRKVWREGIEAAEAAYHRAIQAGMPAEDARGLLPHATTTRVHYATDLRGLMDHAGNRLCTQAQFEWKIVFAGIMRAIKGYAGFLADQYSIREERQWQPIEGYVAGPGDDEAVLGVPTRLASDANGRSTMWQWKLIAEEFRPVCFQLGHCPFMSDIDRGCTIRPRVQEGRFDEIDPSEWLADPQAGFLR